MTRRAEIEILGDASSFAKAGRASEAVANTLAKDMDKLAVRAKESANAQIQASVRKDARLREEIAAYRSVAASAAKGSKEQIAAANLATQAEARLSRSLAITAHESRSLAASSASAERSIGRATRGALAGSGIFSHFGRSLAFASGGFLAFASAGQFLRASVDAAKDAEVTQKQLSQQLANSGKSFAQYGAQIEKSNLALSALSGFTRDDLDKAFTTIFRTAGNVSKALRDTGTAADLARARHIGLAQASFIVAKVEAGNTTLLRRQSFQIAKNATAEQALAFVRAKIAGQAAAGTTEQERFGAVLHDTEEIIGRGILPTLNKYLVSGTTWLEQMNESGKLQENVAKGARTVSEVLKDSVSIVRAFSDNLGGMKNTIELLLALKTASVLGGWARSLGLVSDKAKLASVETGALSSKLAILSRINPIVIPIVLSLIPKSSRGQQSLDSASLGFLSKIPVLGGLITQSAAVGDRVRGAVGLSNIGDAPRNAPPLSASEAKIEERIAELRKHAKANAGEIAALQTLLKKMDEALNGTAADFDKGPAGPIGPVGTPSTPRPGLTAAQKNTFFDNDIARILSRGGLGSLQQQLASINQASSLLTKRLAATKDVTRKLNLEDQILQLAAQSKGIRAQLASDAAQAVTAGLALGLEKAQATTDLADDLVALAKIQANIRARIKAEGDTADLETQLFQNRQQIKQTRQQQTSAREFFTLGLDPTGGERVPLKSTLKRQLGNVTDAVTGTSLDTPKLRSQLAGFRKVLSEGLVPKDVRAKIREMLDGIADELKNRSGNQTKFRHASSAAILSGLGLSPEQVKALRGRLSQVGAGGTVPGQRSVAFAGAGRGADIVVHTSVNLDGQKVAVNTTRHQDKRRTPSRRN